jgi:hypothetical protein
MDLFERGRCRENDKEVRMKRLLLALTVLAVVLPGAATAGGWATVQLSSLPTGTTAGDTWKAELLVLQHGRTPLEGVSPVIRIRNDHVTKEFTATPTGEPGRYAANVTFPSAGIWQWEIWDGFSQTHTYAPLSVSPDAGVGDGSFPALPLAIVVVAMAGALALVLVTRRRRSAPRPVLD